MFDTISNYKLSIREKEVLKLVVKGMSNPNIAERLSISDSTVKAHVSSILRKMAVKNRIEAVVVAVKKELV